MAMKNEIINKRPIQQKELINILMDSELYLDLPLAERYQLLTFILDSYSSPSIPDCNNNPSR
jgi:hypothetical protein